MIEVIKGEIKEVVKKPKIRVSEQNRLLEVEMISDGLLQVNSSEDKKEDITFLISAENMLELTQAINKMISEGVPELDRA